MGMAPATGCTALTRTASSPALPRSHATFRAPAQRFPARLSPGSEPRPMNDRLDRVSWIALLPTFILAVAIVLAGLAVGTGIQRFRSADRFVTVKGVAERPVTADI